MKHYGGTGEAAMGTRVVNHQYDETSLRSEAWAHSLTCTESRGDSLIHP
jgi:hypothetical protein